MALQILCSQCLGPITLERLTAGSEIICPTCGSSFRLEDDPTVEWKPREQRLGRFQLLMFVGQGAFGRVYKALDTELERTVAIKIPRVSLAEGQEHERFLREARSVARLRHPAIVPIHEVGQHEGMPYLVCDFVPGVTLSDVLTTRRPLVREAVALVAAVAEALHYAHEQGVVHRDVKPSNIMLGEHGQAYLMDFGLAKRDAGDVSITADGQVLGTPAYMAPEQARGEGHKVDGRSDVYSLGVVLYQLLTGELPFRGNTRMLLHQVLNDEPRPPRTLNDSIPRDLQTICLQAMAKDIGRRYATAAALAEDLRRFLAGEPVKARPIGTLELTWRWVRRHPTRAGLLAMTGLAAAALVAAAVSLGYSDTLHSAYQTEAASRARAEAAEQQALRANAQTANALQKARVAQAETEKALGLANRYAYFHRIALADAALKKHNVERAEVLLDECTPAERSWEWGYLKRQCHADLLTLRHEKGATVSHVAITPDGRHFVSSDGTGTLKLWEANSGRPVWSKTGQVSALAVHPEGKWLATASGNGRIQLRELPGGEEVRAWSGGSPIGYLAFHPKGHQLAGAEQGGTVGVWDVQTGERVRTFRGHTNLITGLSFGPRGEYLASASWDATVRLYDLENGDTKLVIPTHQNSLFSVACSPDGRLLASAGVDRTLRLWDARDGTLVRTLAGHTFTVLKVAFSPDGRQLASCGRDGTVRTWDVASGSALHVYRGHRGHVHALAFHPAGDRVLSGGNVGLIKLWDTTSSPEGLRFFGEGRFFAITGVRFFPDGRRVLTAGLGHAFQVRDAGTGRLRLELRPIQYHLQHASFGVAPDGQTVFLHEPGAPTEIREASTGKLLRTLPSSALSTHVVQSGDGKLLAAGDRGGIVRLYDAAKAESVGECKAGGPVLALACSPTGSRLAAADAGRKVYLWEIPQGKRLKEWGPFDAQPTCLAFSADGRHLALASLDGTIRLLRPEEEGPGRILRGHSGDVQDLRFHPAGNRLVSCGRDRTVRLWDVETGQEALTLPEMTHMAHGVDFDPRGQRIVAVDQARVLMMWNGDASTAVRRARRHTQESRDAQEQPAKVPDRRP